MKTTNKKDFAIHWLICLLLPALVSLLLMVPRFLHIDLAIYDTLLRLRPAIPENQAILLLNVDDDSISRVGTWPWNRSVLADGLLHLGEFGARAAVFDIEYIDPSPLGVSPEILQLEYPQKLMDTFESIESDISSLFSALANEMIPIEEANDFVTRLNEINQARQQNLLSAAQAIARDNDAYHGKAAGLFGKAYYTVTLLPVDDEQLPGTAAAAEFARQNFAAPGLNLQTENITRHPGIQAVIEPIARHAAGAGFPNVPIDSDGVRRRVELLQTDGQQYYAQLVFRPLLDFLGKPEVIAEDRQIKLVNARLPNGQTQDINIPRSDDGRMLINWPPKKFDYTFRQMSYSMIYTLHQYEAELVYNLEALTEARFLIGHPIGMELVDWYLDVQEIRKDMIDQDSRELYAEYLAEKEAWLLAAEEVLSSETLDAFTSRIDELLENPDLPQELQLQYHGVRSIAIDQFNETRTILIELLEQRKKVREEISDSLIIIGWTGVSTTDIGVNPFDESYMNVGTHAAVANTILEQQFLQELPYSYSLIALFGCMILAGLILRKAAAKTSALAGFAIILLMLTADWALFFFTGLYLRPAVIIFGAGGSFIIISLIKFFRAEGEKRFIRSAFTRYLSADVVHEIMLDPSRLQLGGGKRNITAIFTDIKGFSGISEQLDPQDLVMLLNRYLTEMSNIILELGGTIDKYEGDAIIAFFGAPLPLEDHALRACRAAARIKVAEKELNQRLMEEGILPQKIETRIGLNSGDMVVGNMGSEQKLNYTMMGHNVNLAARLEGVNKQYNSWVLASESTWKQATANTDCNVVFRRLDRVRVVGVREPVRLFEIVGLSDTINSDTNKALAVFDQGIKLFESRDFKQAQLRFAAVLNAQPNDGTAKLYLARCKKFIQQAPPATWDGVFNLSQK
ncbi:MAG: adenylate/guanylate cyclase domain-containing protein [Spirochaetaceae bacterium]|nr:MAG: adenylate/guanylate cyclase domain-containing protein [Spirochaetaceae bacterium]